MSAHHHHHFANRSVGSIPVSRNVSDEQSSQHQYQNLHELREQHQKSQHHGHKSAEQEVDRLTNILVQSIGSASDPEFFGICYKCRGRVLGEGNGCTAMGQIYHIRCFTCRICRKYLHRPS